VFVGLLTEAAAHTHTHTHVHTHIHIYAHMHTHAHTHLHTLHRAVQDARTRILGGNTAQASHFTGTCVLTMTPAKIKKSYARRGVIISTTRWNHSCSQSTISSPRCECYLKYTLVFFACVFGSFQYKFKQVQHTAIHCNTLPLVPTLYDLIAEV